MGEELHHFCGLAMVRLLKPLDYYVEKYNTCFYGLNKLYVLMEKQRNRGQDGAGIACVKLDVDPGYKFLDLQRSAAPDPISDVMERCQAVSQQKLKDIPMELRTNVHVLKHKVPFTGEIFLGHVRYGTDSENNAENCHPVAQVNNWLTRSLIMAGNFNLTNLDELFAELIQLGQHPREKSDTVILTENLSWLLDNENKKLYARYYAQGNDHQTCFQRISENINIFKILRNASARWDGGYCMCGVLGHGDIFAIRDPYGIRPGFYYANKEICVVASERPVIQSIFNASSSEVHEIEPGHALLVRQNGSIFIERVAPPKVYTKCSFERIYFSRGGDADIHKERLKLGENLSLQVLEKCNYDIANTIISYIPNTSEMSYCGLLKGLQREVKRQQLEKFCGSSSNVVFSKDDLQRIFAENFRIDKILCKDAKIRTFLHEDRSRANLVSLAYDVTYDSLKPTDTLVLVDDSIVRGTTLKNSILMNVGRLKPKKIVIVSSAPQIRYPDCYGIDISKIGELVAFRAAICLLKKRKMEAIILDVYKKCKKQQLSSSLSSNAFSTNYVKEIYAPFTPDEITACIVELTRPVDFSTEVDLVYQSIEGLQSAIPTHTGYWYFTGDYPTRGGVRSCSLSFVNWYEGRGNARGYGLVANTLGSSVLIMGKGGADHCLATKLAMSPNVGGLWVSPGNGGTDDIRVSGKRVKNVSILWEDSLQKIVQFCNVNGVRFVIINDSTLIQQDAVLTLRKKGILTFGPTYKFFSLLNDFPAFKNFLKRHGIPTPAFTVFEDVPPLGEAVATDDAASENVAFDAASFYFKLWSEDSPSAPRLCVENAVEGAPFQRQSVRCTDTVGPRVVEKHQEGLEIVMTVLTEGETFHQFLPVQLYRETVIVEGFLYSFPAAAASPAAVSTEDIQACTSLLHQLLKAFALEGYTYSGCCLSVVFCLTPGGPLVVNAACTFTPLETQTACSLLNSDLYEMLLRYDEKSFNASEIHMKEGHVWALALLAPPAFFLPPPTFSSPIRGLEEAMKFPGAHVYHSHTQRVIPSEATSSFKRAVAATAWKVLTVLAVGSTTEDARTRAYVSARCISFEQCSYLKGVEGRKKTVCVLPPPSRRVFTHPVAEMASSSASLSALVTSWPSSVAASTGETAIPTVSPALFSSPPLETVARPAGVPSLTYLTVGVDSEAERIAQHVLQEELIEKGLASKKEKGGVYVYTLPTDPPVKLGAAVSCIGTKTKVAAAMQHYQTIGVDLVALSVNKIVAMGGKPLFFIDCFSSDKLDISTVREITEGIMEGCQAAECEILSGEKAELPGMFSCEMDFNACGFCIGIFQNSLPSWSNNFEEGDYLLGLTSSGLHANGFSLMRGILDTLGLSYRAVTPWDASKSFGEVLLTPSKIYVESILPLISDESIKACTSVTAGGLMGALRQFLPSHLMVSIDCSGCTLLPIFHWLRQYGNLEWLEILNTFNCGFGMLLVVSPSLKEMVMERLARSGEEVHILSTLQRANPKDSRINFYNLEGLEQNFSFSLDFPLQTSSYSRTLLSNVFNLQAKVRTAVLVTDRGTLLQALIEASQNVSYPATLSVIITNTMSPSLLEKAKHSSIPMVILPSTLHDDEGSTEDEALIETVTVSHSDATSIFSTNSFPILPPEDSKLRSSHSSCFNNNNTHIQWPTTDNDYGNNDNNNNNNENNNRNNNSSNNNGNDNGKSDNNNNDKNKNNFLGCKVSMELEDAWEDLSPLEKRLMEILRYHQIQIVCVTSKEWTFSDAFIKFWNNRLLDIQPTLYPTPSSVPKCTYEEVLAYGVQFTGCSVYCVNPSTHPVPQSIISQRTMKIEEDETIESLRERFELLCEKRCYVKALAAVAGGQVEFDGFKVKVHTQ